MEYKSDIEIAQSCEMRPITEIAKNLGIDDEYVSPYGKYKAKIDLKLLDRLSGRRGQDHHYHRLVRRTEAHRQESHGRTSGTVPGTGVRNQGRGSRRRIFPGCTHGGYKPSFYR